MLHAKQQSIHGESGQVGLSVEHDGLKCPTDAQWD